MTRDKGVLSLDQAISFLNYLDGIGYAGHRSKYSSLDAMLTRIDNIYRDNPDMALAWRTTRRLRGEE